MRIDLRPHVIWSVLLISCIVSLTSRAEPVGPDEARALLRQAQYGGSEPGSYRRQNVTKTKTGTRTTTTLTRRDPGKPLQSRTETVTTVDGHPERTRTTLTIINGDGMWQVYGNKAMLMPQLLDAAKVIERVTRASLDSPSPKTAGTKADAQGTDKLMQEGLAVAGHIHISGERTSEAGGNVVRVTRTYDPEARQFFQQVILDQIAEIKKQLPLGKRLLLTTFLAVKGGSISAVPSREVFVIDPQTRRIIASETYDDDGKLKAKRGPQPEPEKIADLGAETFALPSGVEILRPKNIVEAMELGQKLEAEQRKAAAAQG